MAVVRCSVCLAIVTGERRSRTYCGPRCRQAAWRERKRHTARAAFAARCAERGLSSDEQVVLALIVAGWTDCRIASLALLSVPGIRHYVRRLFRHFNVQNRVELAVAAVRQGVA